MTDTPEPGPARKLLASPRSKIRLALICSAVLGVGALSAPRAPERTLPTAEDRAAPLLEARVETREVVRPFLGVDAIAAAVGAHAIAIASPRSPLPRVLTDFAAPEAGVQPDGFGVRVSAQHVLTHSRVLQGQSTVNLTAPDGSTVEARVAAFEPSSGLVLLDAAGVAGSAAAAAPQPPPSGALVVAIGRVAAKPIVAPVFVSRVDGDRYRLSSEGALQSGMPVFTLDGLLFAIVGAPVTTAIATTGAVERLTARASAGEGKAAAGLAFQPLAGRLRAVFGASGALVTEVIEGAPASIAGLEPGDVITAVGDVEIASAELAATALETAPTGTALRLRVTRHRRTRTVDLTPVTAFALTALARTPDEPPLREAWTLLTAGQLADGGIPPSARVVSVGGQPAPSRTQVQAQLGRSPAVPVLVRHGGRQFFVVVETPR